jgi:HEAT repeat protein
MPNRIKSKRKNRGEVSENELDEFYNLSDNELIQLLKSTKPTERTCAAKILGERKPENAIIVFCQALKTEKSLYSKIAISEALGKIGLPALPELIKLLGKIGNNQHKFLPEKPFEKKNYPLLRDIAARTITKIGESALELLIKSIPDLQKESLSEAIDTIGFISYYSKNHHAFKTVKKLINQYKDDEVILWKLIRALQAFPNQESIGILEFYKENHAHKAIRIEAELSIAQIIRNTNNK